MGFTIGQNRPARDGKGKKESLAISGYLQCASMLIIEVKIFNVSKTNALISRIFKKIVIL